MQAIGARQRSLSVCVCAVLLEPLSMKHGSDLWQGSTSNRFFFLSHFQLETLRSSFLFSSTNCAFRART